MLSYFLLSLVLVTVVLIAYFWFDCPYSFPKFEHTFSCHSWEAYDFDDLLDDYFSKEGTSAIKDYMSLVSYWKAVSERRIEKSIWKRHRRRQYLNLLSKSKELFYFEYKVDGLVQETSTFDADSLSRMYPDLKSILGRGYGI